MRVVVGNKTQDCPRNELLEKTKVFESVVVDLGTGDGRFVYKNALENPQDFYIGIDPSEKQLQIFSKKAVRRKLTNVLFVVGSVEILPNELETIANKVYINLPWGTLLQQVIVPTTKNLKNIKQILKTGGNLELVLGYDKEFEPSETKRLELPEISEKLILDSMLPIYQSVGFNLVELIHLEQDELKQIETTWGKKLSFGNKRNIFRIIFSTN